MAIHQSGKSLNMKKYILACSFILGILQGEAQQSLKDYNQHSKKLPFENIHKIEGDTLKNWLPGQLIDPEVFLLKAKFSHHTSKGSVYILPYDNMPCLVPDINQLAPMPGARKGEMPENNMPNATPRYKLYRK